MNKERLKMKEQIKELLEVYEIDLHLLGKLHYDEFIEELTALIEPDYKKRFEEMYPSGLEKLSMFLKEKK